MKLIFKKNIDIKVRTLNEINKLAGNIVFTETTDNSYDGKKLDKYFLDELGQYQSLPTIRTDSNNAE